MIISASRRTDIPAFYADWFFHRLSQGFCTVRNPFNPAQSRDVSLRPEDIDAIVFWTRHSHSMHSGLHRLDDPGIPYYFLYTLTRYDRDLEPHVPAFDILRDDFITLSRLIGPERILWRYDPIILCDTYDFPRHLNLFAQIARALEGATHRVIMSFVNYYAKTRKNMQPLADHTGPVAERPDTQPGFEDFITSLVRESHNHGMDIRSCAESIPMEHLGVKKGKCIDDQYLREVFGILVAERKDPGQRTECRCVQSVDIGAYDTCLHGCRYCYAVRDHQVARQNYDAIQVQQSGLV